MWRRPKHEIRDAFGIDDSWISSGLDERLSALATPSREGPEGWTQGEPGAEPAGDDPGHEAKVADLVLALEVFRAAYTGAPQSAHRLINPLLDLWSIASAVDRSAAAPIEALLTLLINRSLVSSAELGASIGEVEQALSGSPNRREAAACGDRTASAL